MRLWALSVVILSAVYGSSSEVELDRLWEKHKEKYGKHYHPEEDAMRKAIFANNSKSIEEHNRLYKQNLTTFFLGYNQFSDWTPQEMAMLGGALPTNQTIPINLAGRNIGNIVTRQGAPATRSNRVRTRSSCCRRGCTMMDRNSRNRLHPPKRGGHPQQYFFHGHTSVHVLANRIFMGYKGGVFTDANCPKFGDVAHRDLSSLTMIVIGYGMESSGEKYWILKSSWGRWWGDRGCVKVAMNNKKCGMVSEPPCYPKFH